MQLSSCFKRKFKELIIELSNTLKIFIHNKDVFFKNKERDRLIFTSINAPLDLAENENFTIKQLHHSSVSLLYLKELSLMANKELKIKCLSSELNSVIEETAFLYINSDFDNFSTLYFNDRFKFEINLKLLILHFKERVLILESTFTKEIYHFPVTVFNLNDEIELSKSIRLVPKLTNLDMHDTNMFKSTRSLDINYYLEVEIAEKCSYQLSSSLAKRARDASFNILKLMATTLSPNAIPLVASHEKNIHLFDFFLHGTNRKEMSKSVVHKFHSYQFESKDFWIEFIKTKQCNDNIVDISFSIPELLTIPYLIDKPRVIDRLERALIWYGDAAREENYQFQIQKVVSSIETLINYKEDNLTEIFKRRVTILNKSNDIANISHDVFLRADALYKARSNIVHGSSINEKLNFCILELSSYTILRTIRCFSNFGIEKTGFKKQLPEYIDSLFDYMNCDYLQPKEKEKEKEKEKITPDLCN